MLLLLLLLLMLVLLLLSAVAHMALLLMLLLLLLLLMLHELIIFVTLSLLYSFPESCSSWDVVHQLECSMTLLLMRRKPALLLFVFAFSIKDIWQGSL